MIFRSYLRLLLPALFILPVFAQDEKENAGNRYASAVDSIAKPAAVLYDPNNRRDPFLHLATPPTMVEKVNNVDMEVPRGIPPPGIAGTFIDNAGFEGVVIRGGNRRIAILRSADGRAYFLREGDRLFDGYLKTIENDSVVFVRETLMRSGKVLTLEVTKRLKKS